MSSNAERQKAYRQRHQATTERVNTVISVTAKRKLERLARHQGISQKAILEALLEAAERETIEALSAEQERRYYAG